MNLVSAAGRILEGERPREPRVNTCPYLCRCVLSYGGQAMTAYKGSTILSYTLTVHRFQP